MTDITVATNNADKAWVTFSDYNNTHKVYETNDAGNNWTNISGNNLPGLPVNCIVYQGGANDDLYIGTDIGVYYKDNTMTEWAPFNDGLPNVIVKELEIHYDKGTISAATFGRGIWESPLNTLSGVGTKDIKKLDYTIFPNPAKDQITIKANTRSVFVRIFTLTGQKIIESKSKTISVGSLGKGYYIVEIISGDVIARKKLVIK
jgi:xyloglucan-specific exo-beta-1,4-glucanase